MTPTEYMELANRTNKSGNDMVITDAVASAFISKLPDMIEAAYAADRIKASLCYGTKLKELQHVQVDASMATAQDKEMQHAALGIFSEAGEILEMFHDAAYKGITIDPVHMSEELGDVLWFVILMAKNIDCTLEDIMKMNINKLASRYGDKYCDFLAVNRNLEAERETLETSTK